MALNINKINQPQNSKKITILLTVLSIISLISLAIAGVMLYNQTKQTQKLSAKVDELQSFLDSKATNNSSIAIAPISITSSSQNSQNSQTQYCGVFECSELESKDSPKSVKFIGWVGSQNAELDLSFDKEKITGKYRDLYSRTENDLTGTLQYYNSNVFGGGQQTSTKIGQIELDEVKNGLVKGHFSVKIESPGGNIEGIPIEIYKNKNFSVWSGSYKASDSELGYDLYLSSDSAKIKNWAEITIKGTLVIDSSLGNYYIQSDSGTYFSRESWQFKDRKTGDKIEVTGKVRDYFDKKYYYWENQNLETKKGIFNITKVK